MLKQRWLQVVLSFAISAVFIWYAVKGVDFSRVVELLKTASYAYLVPLFAVQVALQYVRVWRFRYLVAPMVELKLKDLFRIGNIGMMAIFLLPVRLGEFVRPYLIKRDFGVSMSASLGAVAAERVIDGLVVTLGFFAVTQSGIDFPSEMRHAGLVAFAVFLGAGGVLAVVLVGHEAGANLLRRVIAVVSPKLADRIVRMVVSFAEGLGALKRPQVLALYMGWTLLTWGLTGISCWVSLGVMHIELPVLAGYVLTALTVIALMLPSGPGFVGPIQAAYVWGLALFMVDRERAFALSVVGHIVNMVVTLGFGLFSLARSHMSMSTLVKESQESAND